MRSEILYTAKAGEINCCEGLARARADSANENTVKELSVDFSLSPTHSCSNLHIAG